MAASHLDQTAKGALSTEPRTLWLSAFVLVLGHAPHVRQKNVVPRDSASGALRALFVAESKRSCCLKVQLLFYGAAGLQESNMTARDMVA